MAHSYSGQEIILIVDDNPENLKVLANFLTEANYRIVLAENGFEAFKLAQKIVPDLILLDVMMPKIDGFETCKKLKRKHETKNIPIIFVTAKDNEEEIVQGFEIGGADYVTKPFKSTVLLARIKTHLSLYQKTKQLANLVNLDGLTLIGNRRAFDEFIDRAWRQCIRDQKPISLLMIDIDGFKLYNDTYGHLEGDDALKIIAQTIDKNFKRPGDFVSRYGGEEFSVILSQTDKEAAYFLAKQICCDIECLDIPNPLSKNKKLTVSIGVETLIPDSLRYSKELILLADDKLYEAKKLGGNQVF